LVLVEIKEGKATLINCNRFIKKISKMKFLSIVCILCISTILIGASCKKQTTDQVPNNQGVLRKVQFLLYTDKDFSTDDGIITFTLSIQNSTNQILWDSVLTPMKIKDIPNLEHKLVAEKIVPDNDTSLLKVGFLYSIENVGNSWHLDSFRVGETFKVVDFNFQ
jgi:hypothetical protein